MATPEQLKKLFTIANPFKEGDELWGGTRNEDDKIAAREEIGKLSIEEITKTILIDDSLSLALMKDIDKDLYSDLKELRINDMKKILLSETCAEWIEKYRWGWSSEVIAAVVKWMSNDELSYVSKQLFNVIEPESKSEEMSVNDILIGSYSHFGSRIQPNSPGDDPKEIWFHVFEGIIHGCGDVILGLNPSSDTIEQVIRSEKWLESIVKNLELPTRYCVLSDIVKQTQAKSSTKVDIGFQSLGGTSKALVGMIGVDVEGYVELCKNFSGLYFETGQGSEVTNHVHENIDMVTLESRCYGWARHIKKKTNCKFMITNDVSGFIGPEVYKNGDQLLRACLEDLAMAKIHGITMGLDVCSTFHMGIDPKELEQLTIEIVDKGAPAFLMAIAGKADPMLGYWTTAMREHPRIRKYLQKKIATPMHKRLTQLNLLDSTGNWIHNDKDALAELYIQYIRKENKEYLTKSDDFIREEAYLQIEHMQKKGFDIGFGSNGNIYDSLGEKNRLQQIYSNGVTALRASLNLDTLDTLCYKNKIEYILIESSSVSRDDYIAHPATGETINPAFKSDIFNLVNTDDNKDKQVLFIISDGWNANAINSHLPKVLPVVKENLTESGIGFYTKDIIVTNGRVRWGYEIGEMTKVSMIVHFIGERPGTGLDQMSVYITYGNDNHQRTKWGQQMDHCLTTAICGIHPNGKSISEAICEVTNVVVKGLKNKCTGVELSKFAL